MTSLLRLRLSSKTAWAKSMARFWARARASIAELR
jgi:hypothetical protein